MLFCKKSTKKKEETIILVCKGCNNETEVKCSEIEAMYTGYKGRLNFFVGCPKCKKTIYIDEEKIPAHHVRRLYRATYD